MRPSKKAKIIISYRKRIKEKEVKEVKVEEPEIVEEEKGLEKPKPEKVLQRSQRLKKLPEV